MANFINSWEATGRERIKKLKMTVSIKNKTSFFDESKWGARKSSFDDGRRTKSL